MVAQNMGGSMINKTISNIVIEWDLTGYNGTIWDITMLAGIL